MHYMTCALTDAEWQRVKIATRRRRPEQRLSVGETMRRVLVVDAVALASG